MKSLIHIYLLVLALSIVTSATKRKLSSELNPNCDGICEHLDEDSNSFNNLLHVQSKSDVDNLHFLWSTVGAPTVLLAKTDKNTTLHVNWKKLMSSNKKDAIIFKGEVHYAFAVVLTKMYEYSDNKSKAEFINNKYTKVFDLSKLSWENVNSTLESSPEKVKATFRTTNESMEYLNNGIISIRMMISDKQMRISESPHQLLSANSSLIDFTLNGLNASYPKARLISETIFMSFDNSNSKKYSESIDYEKKRTIDDEYTPSVFSIYNIKTPETKYANRGGFLQWKPICYLTPKRQYKHSTGFYEDKFTTKVNSKNLPATVALSFFNNNMKAVKYANMTQKFGVEGGKNYYSTANYSSWSFTVGYGDPPKESISLTIILVISIGLGLPILLLIGGGLYILGRKLTNRREPTLLINADE